MSDGNLLSMLMSSHGGAIEETSDTLNTMLVTTLMDIAESATPEQIKQLDAVARGLCEEAARMDKLRDLTAGLGKRAREDAGARQAAIDKVVEILESKSFGEAEAKNAFQKSENYKEFVNANRDKASGIGQGLEEDDDDVVVGDQGLQTKDPFTTLPLQQQSGKFPLKMPCGHVYNHDTIFGRERSSGAWSLKNCAVPGCGKALPEKRDGLKPCDKVKHMIQKRAKNVGGAASQRHTHDVEDLDDD